jgi:glycosyltransferase involved in cell wall biosynthesis
LRAAAERDERQRVRVVSIPGPRHAQNSYFGLLWHALESTGIEMMQLRASAALTFRWDILHVHFPEHVATERSLFCAITAVPLFLAYVTMARLFGKKLVWTIHEVTPSRRMYLARPYLACMRKLTNAYVFMNRTSENAFFRRYPSQRRKLIRRVPHSAFPVTKISANRRRDVRLSLTGHTDCLLLGLLGEIRPYKNPMALSYLPYTDQAGRPLRLVVAGDFHASCDRQKIEEMFHAFPPERLLRISEKLSDEKLAELIQSVDIVFMPYLRGWNSGFAMLALACRARLLCSALPMFREIADTLGPPWIYTFDHQALDLSDELAAVVGFVTRDKPTASDDSRLQRFLAAASFEQAAFRHSELYRDLLVAG